MQYIKEIDIHGYTQQEACKMIDAALKKPDALTLRIIHGYNQGQILAQMVRKRYRSHPHVQRIELSMNPGITDIITK
ncbi:Smr/MutS family protein [Catenibacterium sp.]|uniref:Smr/MutS family protein n=1 Tax=Catenibacterium sp. TaxID=2049022 RepID=UPI003D787186